MTLKSLLAAFLLCAAVSPLRAQDYDDKDVKKSEKLAAADRDFKSLPDDEKQAVILFIASEIHGHRRKAVGADIRTLKGAQLEDLKKKARRNVVVAEQDKEEASVPGDSRLDVKHIDTPPFGRLFADNEWDVLAGSAEAEIFRQNIDKVADAVKKGGGRLVSMHVESSASTLRNTGKAAKLTHLELSKRRAEAAARYALDYLKTKGFALDEDEQVTLDYYGANKNGTSGPSSPFAVPEGMEPSLVAEGSCAAPPDMKAAAAAGDAAKIAAFYDPNKFVQLTFDAVFEVRDGKPGKVIPGEAHVVTAVVDYRERPKIKVPRIRLPRIHIGWPFGNKDRRKARRQVRCPKW
ncbi:MAG: hypothetical protein Q8T11_07815 [Elusimicrobiota bacterium]|nr:hypothetical protein [Elusimicrobiota bacterium]